MVGILQDGGMREPHSRPRRGLRRRRLAVAVCAAAVVSLSCPVRPDGPATRPADEPALKRQIARAVTDLGSDAWQRREQASKLLWSLGRAAEPALRAALHSHDLEVRTRAEAILEKFRYGIYPDTPPEVLELIERYRKGGADDKRAAVGELLKKGSHAFTTVLALARAETDPGLRRYISGQLRRNAARVVPSLLAKGDFAQAQTILESALGDGDESAIRNFAAYHLLRGSLDEQIHRYETKIAVNTLTTRVRAYLHRAGGDLKKAAAAADVSGDTRLLKHILYELGDWKRLADMHPLDARTGGNIEQLGFLAAYHRLAGNAKAFADAVDLIKKHAGGRPDPWYQAEALLLNDRPEDAIDLLIARKEYSTAFELLCAQLRGDRALGLIEQARKERHKHLNQLRISAARLLAGAGEKAHAERMVADLVSPPPGAKLSAMVQVRAHMALGRRDQALAHCAEALGAFKKLESPAALLRAVFPHATVNTTALWKFLRVRYRDEDCRRTLTRLAALVANKASKQQLATLADIAAREGVEMMHTGVYYNSAHLLDAVADVCEAAGDAELAVSSLRKLAHGLSSTDRTIRLGDLLAKTGRWADAADEYRKAWQSHPHDAAAAYLAGMALDRAGSDAEAGKLMHLAVLLPLGNESKRYRLAEAMARHGRNAEADRQREIILRTGRFVSWEVGQCVRSDLYRRAIEKKDYFRAAACKERGRLPCLETSRAMVPVTAYLRLTRRVHLAAARGHLAAGSVDQAVAEADICMRALPGDVDLAIELAEKLDRLGARRQADRIFARVFDHLRKACRRFPNAAGHHNQTAWLAARCRRRLDQALRLASRAVQLKPDNPAYIDTLAEVHFQRGSTPEAVRLMKRCMQLRPTYAYFQEQLKRFRAGDPATDPEKP